MSDHEFERQIQQKMDELRLSPSHAVWEGVEKNLHKEKRRRWLVLWLPIVLLGFTLAGYLMIQNTSNKTSTVTSASHNGVTGKDVEGAVENNRSERHPLTNYDQETDENSVSQQHPKDNKFSASSGSLKNNKQNHRFFLQTEIGHLQEAGKRLATGKRTVNNQLSESSGSENEPLNNNESIKENNISVQEMKMEPFSKLSGVNIKQIDIKSGFEKGVIVEQTNIAANSLDTPDKTKNNAGKNKWKWGIAVNASLSKIIEGGFFNLLEKSTVADVSNYSSQLPSGSPGSIGPSAIASGFGFSAGGFLQKRLTKKIDFSIGVNYSRFNTKILVGQQVDSAMIVYNGSFAVANVSRFYRVDGGKKYHNHYHYIGVPVELHMKIGRSSKAPVYWNTGLSISRLISTNALHFDGTSGIYYNDDNLFNKTQIGISTGLTVKGMEKNKFPFVIGPSFQYNVTNVLKKQVHGNNHLIFASLDLKLLLKN